MRCPKCELDQYIQHKCNFCGEKHCNKHIFPESHNCKNMPKRNWVKTARRKIISVDESHEFNILKKPTLLERLKRWFK